MSDNKIIKWIMETDLRRWLLFLPLAFISAALSDVIWGILYGISMNRSGISADSFIYKVCNVPISAIITSSILVYVGSYIAPHQRVKIFLFCLVSIMGLLLIFGNLFVLEITNYWSCLYGVFMIVGAFVGDSYISEYKEK